MSFIPLLLVANFFDRMVTFPVRFCPFLPVRHLTRDIAPIPHYIFQSAWEFSSSFSTLFATRIHRRNCIHNMDQVLSSASACLHEVVWIGGMRSNGKPFDKIFFLSGISSEKCR